MVKADKAVSISPAVGPGRIRPVELPLIPESP
jgi:hypothetical protein